MYVGNNNHHFAILIQVSSVSVLYVTTRVEWAKTEVCNSIPSSLSFTSLHFTLRLLHSHLTTTTYSNVLVLGCPPRVSCAKCTTFICINIIFTQLEAQCSTPSTCTRMEGGRDGWVDGWILSLRKKAVGRSRRRREIIFSVQMSVAK